MPQVKIAISIPQDIFKTVDKLSKESEFINRINRLFSDPKIQKEQKQTSKLLNKKINDGEQWSK